MFNPARIQALPTLARVEALEDFSACLYLEGVTGQYDFMPTLAPAVLIPLPTGGAVLLDDLEDPHGVYFVPASLTDAVRAALNLCRVTA